MGSLSVQTIEKIFLEQGFQITVNEAASKANVRCPGLKIDSYDTLTFHPKLASCMELFDLSSAFARQIARDKHGKTFHEFDELTAGGALFAVSMTLTFSKSWYDFRTTKEAMHCFISIGHIGSTSLVDIKELKSFTGVSLVKEVSKLVRVNKDTRRPEAIPHWWKWKYAKYSVECEPIMFGRLSKPDWANSNQMQVFWRDIDSNNHTNYKYYIEYVLNTAHLFGTRGEMLNILGNMANGLKEVNMQFYGEAIEGDVLDVHVWEDDVLQNKMYGQVYKATDILFQAELSYFTNGNPSNKL